MISLIALTAIGWQIQLEESCRREIALAEREIHHRQWIPARQRLENLLASPRVWRGQDSAAYYWMGVCEWMLNRRQPALEAFKLVSANSAFDVRAAFFQVQAWVESGRLRDAETRLERLRRQGGSGSHSVREWLGKVYQIQDRRAEAMALTREDLLESLASLGSRESDSPNPSGWDAPGDPQALLSRIWVLDRGTVSPEETRKGLDFAETRNSADDDRIWLGRARLAIRVGDWSEAERWLRRCAEDGQEPDAAVWRAWLDWAQGAGRVDEARRAFSALGPSAFGAAEWQTLRAWFARAANDSGAERQALQDWLKLEPGTVAALERLIEISPAEERGALREAKAAADRGLSSYRSLMEETAGRRLAAESCLERARAAEASGRGFDADCWRALAGQGESLTNAKRRLGPLAEAGEPWAGLMSSDRLLARIDDAPKFRFTDLADASGIGFRHENGETPARRVPETMSGGAALLDYDGDGRLDIYVVQGGSLPPEPGTKNRDKLYRNLGNWRFEDVTAASGLADAPGGYGHGVAVGDYDNDGDPDLFVTRWGSYALYRNRGDGRFEDVAASAGLAGDRDWPTSAAFADLDGDGDLDLYVCHYLKFEPKICRFGLDQRVISCAPLDFAALSDHAFRNDGGRFIDVTESAGMSEHSGRGLGVVVADFDGDGKVDVYVANDLTANFLYRNLGGFRFEEIGELSGTAGSAEGGYQAGMGTACGDFDRDGWPDLAVTNFYGESTTLYRNLGAGAGGFIDASSSSGLKLASRFLLGFGIVAADFDNDGWLDLASANGHVNDLTPVEPYAMPLQLLAGQPGGRFRDETQRGGPGASTPRIGRGLAAGDLDGDGRLDLVVLAQKSPLGLLKNEAPGQRNSSYLAIELEGQAPRSNRDAVGAKVVVTAGGVAQTAQRLGGGSYQSASSPRMHFGLGDVKIVDRVEVTWPSGEKSIYRALNADRAYRLREGRAEAEAIGPR